MPWEPRQPGSQGQGSVDATEAAGPSVAISSRALAEAVFLGDMVLSVVALFLAQGLRARVELFSPIQPESQRLEPEVIAVVLLAWGGAFWYSGAYSLRSWRGLPGEWHALGRALVLATLLTAGALYLSFRDVPRMLFVYFIAIDVLFALGLRGLVVLLAGARLFSLPRQRVAIVGTGARGRETAALLAQRHPRGLDLVGFIGDRARHASGDVIGFVDEIDRLVTRLDITHLVVCSRHCLADINQLVERLRALPVTILFKPDTVDLAFQRAGFEELAGIPVLNLRPSALREGQRLIKRLTDVLLVLAAMPAVLPVITLVALAVRLDSPGPVLFRQPRVGEGGRMFTMYKFRSMYRDAPPAPPGQLHKRQNDPRVTRVGRLIRSLSLDELPQLFNILKGDMSLVGPRPEMPQLVARYENWQFQRFSVPQGLTGWWQVNGRSNRPMHLNTEYDLYYIQHYSPWLDFMIIARTIPTVLHRKGAF